jgi:glucokinase
MRYIIGVDLGGTQLRTALADEEGTLLEEMRVRTEADAGPAAVIDQITASIERVRAKVPADGELLGVGIGSPGPIDPYEGIVFTQPNMTGWTDVPLRALLAERTGLPVELGNDANAAALGEWLFGVGKGLSNLVYITVSTGIGSGVIVDGKLLLGRRGAAAEAGHHIIDMHTKATWEELAAGPGLAAAAASAMLSDSRTLLHTLGTPETITAADVAKAAAEGDPLALSLLDREGELIGIGLVNMLFCYSPEMIVLGGGVVLNNPQLVERASLVIQERAFEVYRSVPIRLAALGDRAGLLGAVALFLHMHEGK